MHVSVRARTGMAGSPVDRSQQRLPGDGRHRGHAKSANRETCTMGQAANGASNGGPGMPTAEAQAFTGVREASKHLQLLVNDQQIGQRHWPVETKKLPSLLGALAALDVHWHRSVPHMDHDLEANGWRQRAFPESWPRLVITADRVCFADHRIAFVYCICATTVPA